MAFKAAYPDWDCGHTHLLKAINEACLLRGEVRQRSKRKWIQGNSEDKKEVIQTQAEMVVHVFLMKLDINVFIYKVLIK